MLLSHSQRHTTGRWCGDRVVGAGTGRLLGALSTALWVYFARVGGGSPPGSMGSRIVDDLPPAGNFGQ